MKRILDMRLAFIVGAAALLPVLAVIAFSIYLVSAELSTMRAASRVKSMTDMAGLVSSLVHELQKERGATGVFLGSGGTRFESELAAQRRLTDDRRNKLVAFLGEFDSLSMGPAFKDRLEQTSNRLTRLSGLRSEVDGLSIPVPDALGYYTRTNAIAIDLIGVMSDLSVDAKLSVQIIAYSNYLKAKERAGIERAIGSASFAAGSFTEQALSRFQQLIGEQNTYMDAFAASASAARVHQLEQLNQTSVAKDIVRMRHIAIKGGLAGDLAETKGGYWFDQMTAKINMLKALEDELAADLQTMAAVIEDNAIRNLTITALIGIAAILASIGISFAIARTLTSMLTEVAIAMRSLAGGDIECALPPERDNEVGDMVKALKTFQENSRERNRLEEASRLKAEEDAAEAQRLKQVADRLEGALTSTMSGIETSIASLKQTADTLDTTASSGRSSAGEAADASQEAASHVQTVAAAAEQMEASIREIAGQTSLSHQISKDASGMSEQAVRDMAELSDKAASVGDIVQLINDIAAQTNLLALNATIEAARAGEAGKGFAVVASEVKSLANQTAKATEDITNQITSLQEASGTVSDVVDKIGAIVGQVSEAITSISAAMEEQAAAIKEVTRSASEASHRTEQVNQGVAQVAHAADTTAEASNGVLSCCTDLSDQTTQLNETVTDLLGDLRAA